MKVKAISVAKTGGPEVLTLTEVDVGTPGAGEVLLRHTAIGLNYVDTYFRSGLYPAPSFPFVPGVEAAGIVEGVGPDVRLFKKGDRVAYGAGAMGAYCEMRTIPAAQLVTVPPGVDDMTAAAYLSKGMTAHALVMSTYPVGPKDTVLVHAAAGGVGLILCEWSKHLGARVIGTVSTEAKARLAKAHGADEVINYSEEDFVARLRELTNGNKATVVYDSVGKTTFLKSLDCLRPLGMMVSFGQSSGAIDPFVVNELSAKGGLYLTRPALPWYIATREALEQRANALFEAIERGILHCTISQRFPLAEAAEAHRALGSRQTTGSSV